MLVWLCGCDVRIFWHYTLYGLHLTAFHGAVVNSTGAIKCGLEDVFTAVWGFCVSRFVVWSEAERS